MGSRHCSVQYWLQATGYKKSPRKGHSLRSQQEAHGVKHKSKRRQRIKKIHRNHFIGRSNLGLIWSARQQVVRPGIATLALPEQRHCSCPRSHWQRHWPLPKSCQRDSTLPCQSSAQRWCCPLPGCCSRCQLPGRCQCSLICDGSRLHP